ncbi:MAG: tetratricopeptide repeat protein [Verrucomicrobiaceae bacterium]
MNSETPIAAYERACRRYLELHGVQDVHERIRRTLELKAEFAAAFACLQANADSSDPAVWFALGDAYSKGWGTTADRDLALMWFRRAVDVGHSRSMVRLGNMLKHGDSDGDPTEAVSLFSRAAELGDASGMIFLGFAYRDGRGVACDNEKAADWFIKAVEAGDSHSMIHAGRMYSWQLRAPEKALKWFLRAAEAGQTESHLELGFLYQDRKSSLYDPGQAVHWYRRVAEGNGGSRYRAMLALAHFCRNGEGTAHDPAEAKAWLVKVIEGAPPKSSFYREAKSLLPKWETEML